MLEIKEKFIFWDFDGVIKDSVGVKGHAFTEIFAPLDILSEKKILEHHENHGGMSRFEKIPLYLEFASLEVTKKNVEEYLRRFSKLTKSKVIRSNWIPGVLEFLKQNHKEKTFFLISATPNEELIEIIEKLKINNFFTEVIGSPIDKSIAIAKILSAYKVDAKDALMIGDSYSDFNASLDNQIKFILRNTEFNKSLQNSLSCRKINDFYHE